jgi:aminoglycoside 6'-N-acetyltransferase I
METEIISADNLKPLIGLVLELWEDCSFDEELEDYKSIIDSESEICYLAKDQQKYIGFIQVGIRNDYVEGSSQLPIAYVEAVYIKPEYRKKGIAKTLFKMAEDWAKLKGLKQIASDTLTNNSTSINFHKKIGFVEVQRIVCFIKEL